MRLGASFTSNINRLFGLEGENGNLVVTPAGNDRALAPCVTGRIGGLTLFERDELVLLGLPLESAPRDTIRYARDETREIVEVVSAEKGKLGDE